MKKFLKNITIRKKMIVSHGTIAGLAVLVVLVGLLGIRALIGQLEGMYHGPVDSTSSVGDVLFYSSDIKAGIADVLSRRTNAYFDTFEQRMQSDADGIVQAIGALKTNMDYTDSAQTLKLLQTLEENFNAGESIRLQTLQAIQKGDFNAASNLYGMTYRGILDEMQTVAEQLRALVEEATEDYYNQSVRSSNILVVIVMAMAILCLILGTLLTHFVTDAVRIPVQQLMRASEEMQKGNLGVDETITYASRDEIGRLADSMRETVQFLHGYVAEISEALEQVAEGDLTTHPEEITDFRGDFAPFKKSLVYILNNLNDTLSEINLASNQVNSGASQIAAGSQTLAQGATEQTASVERVSGTVSDMAQQVNLTADRAVTAMKTMQNTKQQVEECNDQMKQMMSAMDNITQQADQISKIVKTIDDIAFQTNILALNAAVEAARAGAAGKGFAVVADEVRNLAAKSAEAAKTTTDLIGGTVDAVHNGTTVLSGTAQTLTRVVEGSEKTAELVDEIAQAAKDQAEAIGLIGDSIDQITAVVYTTSSTAEESASASEELSSQASSLNDLLRAFQLRSR